MNSTIFKSTSKKRVRLNRFFQIKINKNLIVLDSLKIKKMGEMVYIQDKCTLVRKYNFINILAISRHHKGKTSLTNLDRVQPTYSHQVRPRRVD